MTLRNGLLIALFITYLVYTIYAQYKILKSVGLDNRKKILNSVMIWLVPFIWYFLFKELIFSDQTVMTKKKRDGLHRKNRKGYESGFHGNKGY